MLDAIRVKRKELNDKSVGLAFFVLCAVCSGCVTASSYDYEKTADPRGTKRVAAKSISYSLRRTTLTSGSGRFDPDDCDATLKGAWAAPQQEDVALNQFDASFEGLIKTARRSFAMDDGDCDIRMRIHLQNGWNAWGLLGAFISGFTWTIIPCWGDDNYTLHVVASDKAGKRKTYQLTGSASTFTWLPCILAMPFSSLPGTRVNEITKENWNELARRMVSDGFFDEDVLLVTAANGPGSTSPYIIERLNYSDSTKIGTLVVRVANGNFAAARAWALAYIENLAKDKNVALRTGTKRSETMYALRDEKVEDQLLTIVFETM